MNDATGSRTSPVIVTAKQAIKYPRGLSIRENKSESMPSSVRKARSEHRTRIERTKPAKKIKYASGSHNCKTRVGLSLFSSAGSCRQGGEQASLISQISKYLPQAKACLLASQSLD